MKKSKASLLCLGLSVTVLALIWLSGYDFDSRGKEAVGAFAFGAVLPLGIFFIITD